MSEDASPGDDRRQNVLLVTKPLVAPWTDGAKNLARDLVTHAEATRFHCLVPNGTPAELAGYAAGLGPNATLDPIYDSARAAGSGGGYAPGLRQNARVLARLLKPDALPTYHFFFAPNPRTSAIARVVFAVKRRHVVHSVVSRPIGRPAWFADVHIAVSHHTADFLRNAGAKGVIVIPPGVPDRPPAAPNRALFGLPEGVRAVLFAGDLTEHGGADLVADAILQSPDTLAVMACRPKGHGHEARAAALAARLGRRAVWLGEVSDMPTLLASVDVVALPATDLTGKVDLPLVLLEAMQAGRPIVVSDAAALPELGTAEQGVLCVPAHRDAVAAALLEATPDLGARAQAHVATAFSAHAMARGIEAVYGRT